MLPQAPSINTLFFMWFFSPFGNYAGGDIRFDRLEKSETWNCQSGRRYDKQPNVASTEQRNFGHALVLQRKLGQHLANQATSGQDPDQQHLLPILSMEDHKYQVMHDPPHDKVYLQSHFPMKLLRKTEKIPNKFSPIPAEEIQAQIKIKPAKFNIPVIL